MADSLKDHTGHTIVSHGPRWSGCRECTRWIDTRTIPNTTEGSTK